MNKSELIEHIAKQADISKAAAARSLEALIGAVKTTLKKGNTVTITGFGTFTAPKRAARTGRNPRTGEEVRIKKTTAPRFRPGTSFRAVVADPRKLTKAPVIGRAAAGTVSRISPPVTTVRATTAKAAPAKAAPAKAAPAKAAPAKAAPAKAAPAPAEPIKAVKAEKVEKKSPKKSEAKGKKSSKKG